MPPFNLGDFLASGLLQQSEWHHQQERAEGTIHWWWSSTDGAPKRELSASSEELSVGPSERTEQKSDTLSPQNTERLRRPSFDSLVGIDEKYQEEEEEEEEDERRQLPTQRRRGGDLTDLALTETLSLDDRSTSERNSPISPSVSLSRSACSTRESSVTSRSSSEWERDYEDPDVLPTEQTSSSTPTGGYGKVVQICTKVKKNGKNRVQTSHISAEVPLIELPSIDFSSNFTKMRIGALLLGFFGYYGFSFDPSRDIIIAQATPKLPASGLRFSELRLTRKITIIDPTDGVTDLLSMSWDESSVSAFTRLSEIFLFECRKAHDTLKNQPFDLV